MKRLALSAVLHTRRLLIALLLALAALLLLARALVPFAEGLRGDLAMHLGDLLGMRVEVSALALRLDGWSPRLTLTGVKLTSRVNDQAELSARELQLDLNLFATLAARHLRIEGLTLIGADLELHRTAEGRIEISGLQALGGGQDPGALAFFLRDGHFALTNSRLYWTDSFTGATTIAVDIERLLVVNQQDRHQLRFDARLASEPNARIRVRARMRGAASDLSGWSGELYSRVESQDDLARLLREQLPGNLQLELPGLRLESWWQFADGQPMAGLARLRVDALRARRESRGGGAPAALTLEGLSALAQWSRDGAESRLRVADVRAQGLGVEPLTISLRLLPHQAGESAPDVTPSRRLLGGLGDVELSVLRRLARFALPELFTEFPPNLSQEPLAGHLERLVFALDLPAVGFRPTDWRVKAQLNNIGIAQNATSPGVQGLNLEVDALPKRGFARMSSENGVLDLRPRLAAPTVVERLVAEAGWRIEPAGSLRLQLPDVRLQTPDLSAALRAEFCLHRSASPYVDLHLQVRDLDARTIGRYLPVRVLNPSLVAWLNRALIGGQLTTGDFLLRGRMADFPFDDQQGRFLMDLDIRDGTLDYSAPRADADAVADTETESQPRWPALEGLDAELRIVNRCLEISAQRGRFLNSDLRQGSAILPNLWRAERMIIKAQGQGPFADGRRVLLDTPLEAKLGRLARAFEVDGQLGVELELGVPFSRGEQVDYQGILLWDAEAQAHLDLGDGLAPLALHDIQGRLDFSNQGVQAQGIQARIDEQPISIDVATEAADGEGAGSLTRVRVQGQTPLAVLSEQVPNPAWSLARGAPDWTLAVTLSNRDLSNASTPIELELRSDLEGVSLDFPAPLGKSAKGRMPLTLRAELAERQVHNLAVQLGQLQARLALSPTSGQAPELRAAAIAMNAEPPAPPEARALSVSGRLGALELGPWLDWWKAHRSIFAQGGQPMPVHSQGVAIGRLRLGALEFRDLKAEFAPTEEGGSQVRFQASDNSGTIGLPPAGSDAPVRVELAHWRLQGPDSVALADASVATKKPDRKGPDPRRFGPLDIKIDTLEWNQYPLGTFAVRLVPNIAGVTLQAIRLDGPLLDVRGQGSWLVDAADTVKTTVTLELSSSDAGQLLREIKLYKGLDGSIAKASARLGWPGDPGAFGLASAEGGIQVDFGPGRLLEVEPGVGRMLGILNIAAIQRRLSLDFSDVVDDGLSFDRATGEFAVADGLARIMHFDLLSSTADIRITGTTHLVKETLDQTVTVTPKIGTGVALASAVAGGPLVGAAVLLADKVAGDAVDRLIRHQYRITGLWREPKIDLLGMTINDSRERSDSAAERPSAKAKPPKPEPDNLFLENF